METWRFIILVVVYFISGALAYGAGFMCGAREMGIYYAQEGLNKAKEEFYKRIKEDKDFRERLLEGEIDNANKQF